MWRRIVFLDVGFSSHDRYALFLYGEGDQISYYLNTQHVDGLPIIFVPGNAGSGRQIRSLASLLQNKTESRHTKFHFDVFGVDFNEEFSALHSVYLNAHTKYLREAILHVWNMYDKPPPGIVLYGISYGGIISQRVLEDPEIRSKISMVFALATPFKEARKFLIKILMISIIFSLSNRRYLCSAVEAIARNESRCSSYFNRWRFTR
jgi:pimeloyl-ACP methyl ester carboxylesterase